MWPLESSYSIFPETLFSHVLLLTEITSLTPTVTVERVPSAAFTRLGDVILS